MKALAPSAETRAAELALEQTYDGPIPPHRLALARWGTPELVALMAAKGERRFYREMTERQIKNIRMRRADGTYFAAMALDLACYRTNFKLYHGDVVRLERAM